MIETARLRLVPCDASILRAVVSGRETLAAHLGIRVPEGWPAFPEAYAHALEVITRDPTIGVWWTYLFIDRESRTLSGSGGYTGRPTQEGVVELGYEIVPSLRGRELATEAARGLLEFAFTQAEVRAVIAHTLPEQNASTRVLEKIGLRQVGSIEDPEDGTLWTWRIERAPA